MLYRMWKLKKKTKQQTKQVLKSDQKVVQYCCGRCPLAGRPALRVELSSSKESLCPIQGPKTNLSKPLQLSLIPLRWRSLVRERNNNMSRWRRSERMLHSEQNFTGPPCIMSPVHPPPHRPTTRLMGSHLKWVDLLDNFVCWNFSSAQSSWYYKFAIWGTIYY